jgi:cell division protein FtsL
MRRKVDIDKIIGNGENKIKKVIEKHEKKISLFEKILIGFLAILFTILIIQSFTGTKPVYSPTQATINYTCESHNMKPSGYQTDFSEGTSEILCKTTYYNHTLNMKYREYLKKQGYLPASCIPICKAKSGEWGIPNTFCKEICG